MTVRDGDRHAAAVGFCHRMDKWGGGGGFNGATEPCQRVNGFLLVG